MFESYRWYIMKLGEIRMEKRKTTQSELNEIIMDHQHWLRQDIDGWEFKRADLSNLDLSDANLTGINLTGANLTNSNLTGAYLTGANLTNSNLTGAYLTGANLTNSNLTGAYLTCANLSDANLGDANLTNANLIDAYLTCANLSDANLGGANLTGAYLSAANLRGANLTNANLTGAYLSDANLTGVDLTGTNLKDSNLIGINVHNVHNMPHIPLACPSEGSFIGWKKIGNNLIKLEIPKDARRSSSTSIKCRCDKANVLGIYNLDGSKSNLIEITNHNFQTTLYKVGKMVYPDSYDENRWNECSNGIHFFIDKQSAIDY